jgi:hypothetical protein
MVRVGMTSEAQAMLKELKSNPMLKNDDYGKRKVEDFENRLDLLSGQTGRARLTVWPVPAPAKDAPTVVCWEIGPATNAQRFNRADIFPSVTGEDLPGLDGKYDLQIFYGPTPTSVRQIATLPAAKAQGSWTSPQPLGPGYLVAEAREKSTVLFSSPAPIVTKPNLLINPQFHPDSDDHPQPAGANRQPIPGWTGLGPRTVSIHHGGPRQGGDYARLSPVSVNGNNFTATQRIPLDPGKEYFLTAWLRSNENFSQARLSGQFFDKDGKPLGQMYVNPTETDRWTQPQRQLVRTRTSTRGEQVIPDRAVEFELMIQANGGFDVDSLYFGESIPDQTTPPPPANNQ